jgi:1,4-alpha-glucan branching enzyme
VPAAGPLRAFEQRDEADGRRRLRVQAPAARLVEVSGDFTDWEPVRLTRAADGWWEARLPIAAGLHQLNVRVDGGEWLVPPGLSRRADGLGGLVGVLLVR